MNTQTTPRPRRRTLATVAAGLVLAGLSLFATAVPAQAQQVGPVTTGCGAKYVQVNWTNTGQAWLWAFTSNDLWDSGHLVGTWGAGSHSYNSGLHTWTWGFNKGAPGTITIWGTQCVSFN
ncbi:hypothetical protein G3T36_13480 [Diaminobutyricibacter tongyongensis]|uniref:Uncharacterized protein n=1 Tax=Leifsonia tongyongensis TaxID=1268043 RepID=A0A6L9Y0R3_9MICO|nr:hypothetical protein [Diaminobutyricibacter tongyongensis]NEN06874.1 hypothetical protein [Diaminobutyricibacter tongyongensis]